MKKSKKEENKKEGEKEYKKKIKIRRKKSTEKRRKKKEKCISGVERGRRMVQGEKLECLPTIKIMWTEVGKRAPL